MGQLAGLARLRRGGARQEVRGRLIQAFRGGQGAGELPQASWQGGVDRVEQWRGSALRHPEARVEGIRRSPPDALPLTAQGGDI